MFILLKNLKLFYKDNNLSSNSGFSKQVIQDLDSNPIFWTSFLYPGSPYVPDLFAFSYLVSVNKATTMIAVAFFLKAKLRQKTKLNFF